jgi:hypothetical protein
MCGGKVEKYLGSFYSGDPDMIMSCLTCSTQSVWLYNRCVMLGMSLADSIARRHGRRYFSTIVGHRHQDHCRWHGHSDIQHLSPVPEHSSNGLGLLSSVLDWFRHRHLFSFQNLTDQMSNTPALWHSNKFLYKEVCQ